MSGLASLSATYTDSEGEDDSHHRSGSTEKSVAVLVKQPAKSTAAPRPKHPSKVARLVSYNDDIVLSDDEGDLNVSEDKDNGVIVNEDEGKKIKQDKEKNIFENSVAQANNQSDDDDIQLPPEPNGICDISLQEKILKYHKQMELSSWDMNEVIQGKKNFRNPSIYEKLIQYCGINELGTNYPPSIYDPERWGKESFYDELSKAQKVEMEKREKERKERTKVEFVSGTAKRSGSGLNSDDSKNRKSKWDQVGGLAASVSVPGLLRPIGIMQQTTLTSSGTGTKATVISAFGSLPKRPKI